MTVNAEDIHQFTSADESRHRAGDNPWWQESIAFHWYDAAARVGGVHRIGHEPGREGGVIAHHHGVLDAHNRWRQGERRPMAGELDADWFGDAAACWTVVEDHPRLLIDTPECGLDLVVDNLYPLTDFFPKGNRALNDEFAARHYETSGRVRGTARVGDREYGIDGFSHRDHSWGVRLWKDAIASHRWISGVIDEDLAFGSVIWNAPDGSLARGGYIVRDGEVLMADSTDVVTWLEVDGVTHRGGELLLTFGDEVLRFTCHRIDGWLNEHHGVTWVDMLCEVMHDGRTGYCDFEISNNARMGSAPVRLVLGAASTDGLAPRD